MGVLKFHDTTCKTNAYAPAMRVLIVDYRAVVGLMSYSPKTRSASPCSTTGRRAKTCPQDFPRKSKVSRILDNLSMLMYSVARTQPTLYYSLYSDRPLRRRAVFQLEQDACLQQREEAERVKAQSANDCTFAAFVESAETVSSIN